MHHRPFVFLDIETTGGVAQTSRIMEIGAVRVENGTIVGTFNKLVNPECTIPPFITELTHISNKMVEHAPFFEGIADELEMFLQDTIFIAHHVAFDYSFIRAEYTRLNRQFAMDRLCSAKLSRRLYPNQARHNLDTLIKVHGISVKNRHRAYDDALALYEFYKSALKTHDLAVYAAMNHLLVKSRIGSKS